MYFIDPAECIDCGVCVPECPVDAIYPDDDLPGQWGQFAWINSGFFGPDDGMSGSPVPRRNPPPRLEDGASVPFPEE
jgi:ferredoxin--NADP+ reductase